MTRSRLMTVREVADLCGVYSGTIHAAIRAGELRALRSRPGAGYRLRRTDVVAWLEECASRPRTRRAFVDPGQLAFDLDDASRRRRG